jgi:DNA-directed RNA polymerase sigma subunit (sigma70/sigma32)
MEARVAGDIALGPGASSPLGVQVLAGAAPCDLPAPENTAGRAGAPIPADPTPDARTQRELDAALRDPALDPEAACAQRQLLAAMNELRRDVRSPMERVLMDQRIAPESGSTPLEAIAAQFDCSRKKVRNCERKLIARLRARCLEARLLTEADFIG